MAEPIVTRHGTLRTRPETTADATFLSVLHDSVKSAGFDLIPIGEQARRQLLELQFRAMTTSYRAAFPSGRFEIVTLNETPIGRLITDSNAARFHVVHVALLPEWRNRGIGTELMTSVLAEPRHRGVPCDATVALDNLASLRLWSRLGFRERTGSATDVIMEWRPD